MGIVRLALGRALAASAQPHAARSELERAVELSARWRDPLVSASARLALAELARSSGASEEAARLVEEARAIVERCPDPGIVASELRRAADDRQSRSSDLDVRSMS